MAIICYLKNKINGMMYIMSRKSKKNYKRDMSILFYNLRKEKYYQNKILQDDFLKYGEENFERGVIAEVDDIVVKEERMKYMKEYNSIYPHGYNVVRKQKMSKNEYSKKWYSENKSYCRERNKRNYKKNKVNILKSVKRYHEEHKEELREYKRRWYKENKKRLSDKNKEWYKKNKEHMKETAKRWYQNNKERVSKYNKKNKKRRCEVQKRWYYKNREKILKRRKEQYYQNKILQDDFLKKYWSNLN